MVTILFVRVDALEMNSCARSISVVCGRPSSASGFSSSFQSRIYLSLADGFRVKCPLVSQAVVRSASIQRGADSESLWKRLESGHSSNSVWSTRETLQIEHHVRLHP